MHAYTSPHLVRYNERIRVRRILLIDDDGAKRIVATVEKAPADRIAALDRRLAEWRWCNFPRHESTN